ncbi:hypothetical protein OROMI_023229 [Orobanche minor]
MDITIAVFLAYCLLQAHSTLHESAYPPTSGNLAPCSWNGHHLSCNIDISAFPEKHNDARQIIGFLHPNHGVGNYLIGRYIESYARLPSAIGEGMTHRDHSDVSNQHIVCERSPRGVSEAYLGEFKKDFSLFVIKSKSEEVVRGGTCGYGLLGNTLPNAGHSSFSDIN